MQNFWPCLAGSGAGLGALCALVWFLAVLVLRVPVSPESVVTEDEFSPAAARKALAQIRIAGDREHAKKAVKDFAVRGAPAQRRPVPVR